MIKDSLVGRHLRAWCASIEGIFLSHSSSYYDDFKIEIEKNKRQEMLTRLVRVCSQFAII